MKTVVIAMSGGVDSSVAAFLLKKQGYRVIGLFMKNWADDEICSAQVDFEDVAQVANSIGISYYTVNFSKEYKELVFKEFLDGCQKGLTPNPDILCNREIKFKVLLEKALELGGDFLATGHHCQIGKIDGQYQLLKGKDPNKDQSYFLSAIDKKVLNKILFPIGHLMKSEIRSIAKENDLVTFDKKDSTGICFIGKRNFKSFLKNYIGYTPGDIVTLSGEKIQSHDGLAFHTIGQRKGLDIGGKGDAWYVVGKNTKKNLLYVAQGKDHPALFSDRLIAEDLNWITKPETLPFNCKAKVRYRQQDQDCIIEKIENNKAYVRFKKPQRAITKGQAAVFYKGSVCLGGGKIISVRVKN